ncbi:hypothetical protein CEW46_32350, partial [Bacillus cereus]
GVRSEVWKFNDYQLELVFNRVDGLGSIYLDKDDEIIYVNSAPPGMSPSLNGIKEAMEAQELLK